MLSIRQMPSDDQLIPRFFNFIIALQCIVSDWPLYLGASRIVGMPLGLALQSLRTLRNFRPVWSRAKGGGGGGGEGGGEGGGTVWSGGGGGYKTILCNTTGQSQFIVQLIFILHFVFWTSE